MDAYRLCEQIDTELKFVDLWELRKDNLGAFKIRYGNFVLVAEVYRFELKPSSLSYYCSSFPEVVAVFVSLFLPTFNSLREGKLALTR
jgi:hypothetical protein